MKIFKRNYLENYNDSEGAVKTKNAPFFMNFMKKHKNGNLFSHWTGPLTCLPLRIASYPHPNLDGAETEEGKKSYFNII